MKRFFTHIFRWMWEALTLLTLWMVVVYWHRCWGAAQMDRCLPSNTQWVCSANSNSVTSRLSGFYISTPWMMWIWFAHNFDPLWTKIQDSHKIIAEGPGRYVQRETLDVLRTCFGDWRLTAFAAFWIPESNSKNPLFCEYPQFVHQDTAVVKGVFQAQCNSQSPPVWSGGKWRTTTKIAGGNPSSSRKKSWGKNPILGGFRWIGRLQTSQNPSLGAVCV